MDIVKYYQDGYSIRQIATLCQHSRKTITAIIKDAGIPIRTSKQTSRKYVCDEHYFDVIDNCEKAYWLGFILADGFIESKRKYGEQKLGITLAKSDIDHLRLFNQCLHSTYQIKEYNSSGYNPNGSFAKILITSQTLVNSLKQLGVIENKTPLVTFPNVDPKFRLALILGYFDGDGSIYSWINNSKQKEYSISFTGTYEMLSEIQNILNISNKISLVRNQIYEFKVGGITKPYNILCKLYKDSPICLERKYQKFLELKKYIER